MLNTLVCFELNLVSDAAMESISLELAQEKVKQIPPSIRFGTSTWTYPGWKGSIYKREYKNEKEFKKLSLQEYASMPIFRTVGIDSTFYSPASSKLLADYAQLLPADFTWVSKVWERLTIVQYPKHARYGALAGKANPDFLSAQLFIEKVLAAYKEPAVLPHTGPFVFQFATINPKVLKQSQFFEQLAKFLKALPGEFRYAFEIRNPDYLCPDYFAVLNESQATHCFNHWNYMPSLKIQMQKAADAGGLKSNFFVARLLTPHGISYEQAVKLFAPYDAIKRPNPEMRADAVRLVKRALERNADAYIIVNNRSEGNAPQTISAIIQMITG